MIVLYIGLAFLFLIVPLILTLINIKNLFKKRKFNRYINIFIRNTIYNTVILGK